MWNPGIPDLLIILAIALLVFGPKKLPEIGKAVGGSVSEFKKAMEGKTEATPSEEVKKETEKPQEGKKEPPSTQ